MLGDGNNKQQLFLNYCYGHKNSSLLFWPYSPIVNLVNHDETQPNVVLRWSDSSLHRGRHLMNLSVAEFKKAADPSGLLLELGVCILEPCAASTKPRVFAVLVRLHRHRQEVTHPLLNLFV
jgi:hypothetical protein